MYYINLLIYYITYPFRQLIYNPFAVLKGPRKLLKVSLPTRVALLVWLFLAAVMLLPVVLLQFYDLTFWWEYGNGRGLQGRYWLGTVVPMLAFFAAGLLAWLPPRWHPAGHTLLRLGIILLNIVSLLGYIMPRYYL